MLQQLFLHESGICLAKISAEKHLAVKYIRLEVRRLNRLYYAVDHCGLILERGAPQNVQFVLQIKNFHIKYPRRFSEFQIFIRETMVRDFEFF